MSRVGEGELVKGILMSDYSKRESPLGEPTQELAFPVEYPREVLCRKPRSHEQEIGDLWGDGAQLLSKQSLA